MAYRNIVLTSPAKLSIKNKQLIIQTEGKQGKVPLEDINAILFESPQITLNCYLLNALAQEGICTFFCDEKHLPSAILLSYKTHSRKSKMLNLQINMKKTFIKQAWQQIIIQKIENQAKVLSMCDLNQAEHLLYLSRAVKSGDSDNLEAVAAARYFPALFGNSFVRSSDCGVNAALNYGYAILRGHICRSLAVYGLEPELGIFHSNQLNAFNLADDLIEPFRPVVDLFVAYNIDIFQGEFTPTAKHQLFNIMNFDVCSGGEIHPVHYAIERMVQSFSTSLKDGNVQLKLCSVLPPKMHSYE